ncbi:MAG: cell division protein FtsQ/DivIB [Candidatus Saccharicenans sp.]|nr:cell division protein FtsQ/DivIB [Candidatus Saccharicenans sp.]MDI6849274.1 cell division protein FtsQ/DivIB [Candidatus Saccharicenans sp.]
MAVENGYPLNVAGAVVYHRSARPARLRGKTGKKCLRWTHLVGLFFGLILFFLGVAQVYYYLITCDQLRIKNIEVVSVSPELKQRVENFLRSRNPGNILILDLDYLRLSLSALPGVKEVRAEKILPSTLRVEVYPRTPRLYVHRGLYFLVDEEGQVIRSDVEVSDPSYPVLEDEAGFNQGYREKVGLACRALAGLEPGVRPTVRSLRFTSDRRLEVELADDPARIIISAENFPEQLPYYLANREAWTRLFGPLEYVDLRIEGRAYVKPLELSAREARGQKKEVS